ncbi:hypothetical protein [Nocardioides currus]|uniref:Uncharacterized protein n=1 Tax=Nocardioides currus TaxID=2133958 RepID=A0A2R7Z0F3_9ACTN|nr:hypothetical protein [Nocardioides currus]PUA82095.1 hypothetical protein C7S10_08750 [Nocardioides currus]
MSTVAEPESEPIGPDLYRIAVEEYRFQAQFNWNRVQYLLAFNAGILAAGVALAKTSGALAVVVFALGIVACGMTVLVQRVQHNYYRNARDRMRRIEKSLQIDHDALLDTTSTLAGQGRRISVTQILYLLLASIAVADLVSILFVAF